MRDNSRLAQLVREFFDILETEEESSSGRRFQPTTITSCRVLHTRRLGEILPEMKSLAEEE